MLGEDLSPRLVLFMQSLHGHGQLCCGLLLLMLQLARHPSHLSNLLRLHLLGLRKRTHNPLDK